LLPSILATVKTAVATTATATTASSTAAMLAKGAMKAMFIAKVKTAAVSVLATVIVAGCGTIAVQELAQRKKAEQPAAAQQNEPPTKAPNGALTPIKPVVEAKPATVLGETAPNSSHAEVATTWQHVTKPVLPSAEIQLVKVGDKGELWIGMRNGLAKVEGGVLQLVAEAKNLSVWDVTPCPAGGVWIGHSAGAMLMDGVRTAHSVKGLKVSSIRMVGTQLWAIAGDESKDRNTLMLADGTDWAPEPAFKGRHVLDLIKDAKGTFWLVLDGDGVMEVDSGKPAREAKQYLRRMNVTSILSDSQGRTWCGLMSGGVMVRQNNAWKSRLEKERSAVLSLLEDSNGNIWAATSGNGIWMYDGKAWKSMLPDSDYVNLMKMTSDKRIWVSTPRHGGLRYWNGDEWKASLNCIYPVHSLVELPNGTLLAATSRDGIYVLGDFSIKLPVGQ
ncbi:MAG: ligand-binding sensor domain-containing protein, partial [Kiritimatiellia bacterium]